MKEINGTITLAYLEEDNKQRVIFRVVPLCTREGSAFHGDAEGFPDEGSMRIVPDKREQSTFKERMRAIGSLCAIYLVSDGKELMKVRPNRNYAPDQGERNQLAIYSDVICEFAEDGCFEVVELGASADSALTAKVLLHKDKLLYGPVDRQSAASATLDTLKPFGNDQFLLHTVGTEALGTHRVCWNPEATVNWRQRRNAMRHRDRTPEGGQENAETVEKPVVSAEKPAAASVKPAMPADKPAMPDSKPVVLADKPATPAEKPAPQEPKSREPEKPVQPAPIKPERAKPEERTQEQRSHALRDEAPARISEKDQALPIGARLDILDNEMPFEQQIDRLAQPLSDSANRLSDLPETPAEEEGESEVVARFTGTPLTRTAVRASRSVSRPETVHRVVEQQLRGQRDEVMGAEMGENAYGIIENPIESLQSCVDYIWQSADMRKQALSALMENESFVSEMVRALRQRGLNLEATAAAQEQLAEIEAERLGLLMQLESAKANEHKFREEAIAALSQKKREESERLTREVSALRDTEKTLREQARVLSEQNASQLTDYIAQNMTFLSGVGEQRILLSPVVGQEYTQAELAEHLRVHMNDSGFSLSEDDTMSLLISFALCDSLCLRAPTIRDANRFAQVLLESFGLQSVSAVVMPGAYVEMVSLLSEDLRRTPTVTVQPLGTETMSIYGHKTIFLTDDATQPMDADSPMSCPVINAPPLMARAFGYADEWKPIAPASLSSLAGVRADSHPLMEEAEKWFTKLAQELSQCELLMPESSMQSMRRFIEIASRKVRGGFLAAADIAVACWVVPMLMLRKADPATLAGLLSGLPRTMELLAGRQGQ